MRFFLDDMSIGTIVTITILSILLTIAVAVIIFQRFKKSNSPRDTRQEITQNQEQSFYENDPQHYYDLTAVDDNQQYIELDTTSDACHYQNMS